MSEKLDNSAAVDESNIKAELGNRYLMDLCIMAAKLVYENKKVIQAVVDRCWKASTDLIAFNLDILVYDMI